MKRKIGIGIALTTVLLWAAGLVYSGQNISSYTGTMTAGSGGAFSVATDGRVSSPEFLSTATDGQHYVKPYNGVAFNGTPAEGMVVTDSSGAMLQYHGSAWVPRLGGTTGATPSLVVVTTGTNGSVVTAPTTIDPTTGTITTPQQTTPDSILLRTGSGAGSTGVTILGPATAPPSTYSLQMPAAEPTSNQYLKVGSIASHAAVLAWTDPSGGSMVYPGAGVPVSTGSAWSTSKTAPSGALVGDSDTQTLTNKSITALEVDGHASGTLSAAQVSGTVVYNTGQAASDVALTLPVAAAGYQVLFTVGTAQSNKWGVRANTTDKIYLLNSDGTITAGSDNGYARMTAAQVGQSFACWTFKTDNYDWACKAVSVGTSTFAAN